MRVIRFSCIFEMTMNTSYRIGYIFQPIKMRSKAIGIAILAIALFFLYDQYKGIHRKENYGIDSPFHVKLFSLLTITSFVGAMIFSYIKNHTSYKRSSWIAKWIFLLISFVLFLCLFCSLYASLI